MINPPRRTSSESPRIAVIACAVLEDEVAHFADGRPEILRIDKLPQGLHNTPDDLRTRVQQTVDEVERDSRIDTIVLVYGLCSRGTEGVVAQRCRLIVPRAHDCITLLLGSKQRYAEYVREHPGTYWYSPGWNRHHIPPGPVRYNHYYEQYRERYGEDNAEYLMEQEQHWFRTYDRATYVDLTVGATDEDLTYTAYCADWLKWKFDRVTGDPALLADLLTGPWDDDRYCVLEPGQTLRMTADERVIEAVHEPACST